MLSYSLHRALRGRSSSARSYSRASSRSPQTDWAREVRLSRFITFVTLQLSISRIQIGALLQLSHLLPMFWIILEAKVEGGCPAMVLNVGNPESCRELAFGAWTSLFVNTLLLNQWLSNYRPRSSTKDQLTVWNWHIHQKLCTGWQIAFAPGLNVDLNRTPPY